MHDTTTRTTPAEALANLRNKTLADLRLLAPDHQGQLLTTEQLAELLGVQPATIRRGHCMAGHYGGLIPAKLHNGRLRWKIA